MSLKKYSFNEQNISHLSELLYDSQFLFSIISKFNKEENSLELEIIRPDYNRTKFTKFLGIYKSTIVYTNKSILKISNIKSINYNEKNKDINWNINDFETIYDLKYKNKQLLIDTEQFNISINITLLLVDLEDIEQTSDIYLRISGWKNYNNFSESNVY